LKRAVEVLGQQSSHVDVPDEPVTATAVLVLDHVRFQLLR
jgi:hypothetical protein